MILLDNQQKKYIASKCPRPKIGTTSFGRLWDAREVTLDGKAKCFHWEVARGTSYYFQFDNNWFRLPFFPDSGNDPFYASEFFTN